jgi:prephenate dehydratase
MRVAYLGPEGTNSHEALIDATRDDAQPHQHVALPTIHDCVMAVQRGEAERAFVPVENALGGAVDAALDALAVEAEDVAIVGERVHAIHTCLIARAAIALEAIETVVSHPQANAQCARFLRTQLPQARIVAASSTAEAVRTVAEQDNRSAALGSRTAADLYGCTVLREDVDDAAGNETRFVWLARAGEATVGTANDGAAKGWKTAIVFWGIGDEAPGWLARCLTELAEREVNLTRIESRPRRQALGHYMFFLDIAGRDSDAAVAESLAALRGHVEHLRVLGSFPAAP